MVRDVDARSTGAVETVRGAVERRRRAFAHDLYQQFEVVQGLEQRPEWVDAYRRDAARFVEAFEACAQRARDVLPEAPDAPDRAPDHSGAPRQARRVRRMPARLRTAAGTPASRHAV
jgi:hypothetical protein